MVKRLTKGALLSIWLLSAVVLVMMSVSCATADEFRGWWGDGWGTVFSSQANVDKLLGVPGSASSRGTIRDANLNAVILEVRRRADTAYPSGMGEPYMSGLSPSNFNALQAIINAAHDTTGGKQRIEVHCWMVTFATAGGAVYAAHSGTPTGSLTTFDNYWPTRDDTGAETTDKAFDPGHPGCEEYIVNVAMDLVNNFDIDGIHYDYIRFTANNQGYNPTSVARYNARYGTSGQPAFNSVNFQQWRRDQVSAVVRKVYAKIQAAKPWVKQSGAFVSSVPSPTASTRAAFQSAPAYTAVYSDWDSWLTEGIVDMAVPMNYFDQTVRANDYANWINFEKDRHGNRHMVIGPGLYLNSQTNAISQLLMTRDPSPAGNYAQGFCGYDYATPYSGGSFSTSWISALTSQVTPSRTDIPAMPWKTSPTKGHISGTVTMVGTGAWADGATVSITGPESRSMLCDGTGFYSFIDLTPGAYTITASKSGWPDEQAIVPVAVGVVTGNMYVTNLVLGSNPLVITNVRATATTNSGATIAWDTNLASISQVEYGLTASYGSTTTLNSNPVVSHSVNLSGLSPARLYHYRVRSAISAGAKYSADCTFNTDGPPGISNVAITNITSSSATITWMTNASADSTVNYGTTTSYGSHVANASLVTSHSVTLTGLTQNTAYNYRCVSANGYGSATSSNHAFATLVHLTQIVVDNADPGWANTSASGSWAAGSTSGIPMVGSGYIYASCQTSTVENSSTRKCTWTPALATDGYYDVYVFYQKGSNRTTTAPYTVYYHGGNVNSIQNQNGYPSNSGYFLAGQDLPFLAGAGGYVELSTLATGSSGVVDADAAKWVFKSALDTTPPVMTSVTDEIYTTSTTSLVGNWSGTDSGSGITRYEYAVGTTSGGTNVKGWTSAGTATSATITGLSLALGNTYYISSRAVDGMGQTSTQMTSAGVKLARAMSTIQHAKGYADGEVIALPSMVVSATFNGKFYIEEANRVSAIRVESGATVSVGQNVTVFGVMGIADGCERAILNPKVITGM